MAVKIKQNVLSPPTYANLSQTRDCLGQISGLGRDELSAQDSASIAQTTEIALNDIQSIILRMRELALQSANDILPDIDRVEIQKKVEELKKQIDSIAELGEFNAKKLLSVSQLPLATARGRSDNGGS